MANVIDYLRWRGDVPFSADPFNEADNLILAELSYAHLEGIVPEDGSEVTVAEARDRYFALYPREEPAAKAAFSANVPFMLDEMAEGGRFRDAALSRYVNDIDAGLGEQFSAVTVRLGDGSLYIAFRGTDGTFTGWREDFEMSYTSGTAGQKAAARYLSEAARSFSGPVRVGGHSKGGNFAVYAAAFCEKAAQERIVAVYSNDGPGFREEVTKSEGYLAILPKIVSIIPDSSAIGVLLTSAAERRVVKSSASGIMQHDGFSWQLTRNRFIEAEQAEISVFIGKTVDSWLTRLDDETRSSAVDTVFSALEATGAESFRGLGEKKLKKAEAIAAAMRGVPREKQKELIKIMGDLFKSGGQVAAEYMKKE